MCVLCSTVVTSADLEIMVGALCGGMSVLSALVRIDKQKTFVTRNSPVDRRGEEELAPLTSKTDHAGLS